MIQIPLYSSVMPSHFSGHHNDRQPSMSFDTYTDAIMKYICVCKECSTHDVEQVLYVSESTADLYHDIRKTRIFKL